MIKKIVGEKISLEFNPETQEFTLYKDFNGFQEEFYMSLKDAKQMREMFDFIWGCNNLWKYEDRDHMGLAVPKSPIEAGAFPYDV